MLLYRVPNTLTHSFTQYLIQTLEWERKNVPPPLIPWKAFLIQFFFILLIIVWDKKMFWNNFHPNNPHRSHFPLKKRIKVLTPNTSNMELPCCFYYQFLKQRIFCGHNLGETSQNLTIDHFALDGSWYNWIYAILLYNVLFTIYNVKVGNTFHYCEWLSCFSIGSIASNSVVRCKQMIWILNQMFIKHIRYYVFLFSTCVAFFFCLGNLFSNPRLCTQF